MVTGPLAPFRRLLLTRGCQQDPCFVGDFLRVVKRICRACLSLRITGVGRVDHGRVQDTVDLQEPRLLVQLVLDPGAFGDLDEGCELFRGFLPDRYVVPGMGHIGSSRKQGRGSCRPQTYSESSLPPDVRNYIGGTEYCLRQG